MKFVVTRIWMEGERQLCSGIIEGLWEFLKANPSTEFNVETRLTPHLPPAVVFTAGNSSTKPIEFTNVPFGPYTEFHVVRVVKGGRFPELWQPAEVRVKAPLSERG